MSQHIIQVTHYLNLDLQNNYWRPLDPIPNFFLKSFFLPLKGRMVGGYWSITYFLKTLYFYIKYVIHSSKKTRRKFMFSIIHGEYLIVSRSCMTINHILCPDEPSGKQNLRIISKIWFLWKVLSADCRHCLSIVQFSDNN